MQVSRFDLAKSEWEDIYTLCKDAENNLYFDPNITLIKLRQSAELIVKYIFNYNNMDNQYTNEFHINTSILDNKKLISKDLLEKVNRIRKIGNQAVHNGFEDLEKSKELIDEMFEIVAWFVIKYSKIDVKELEFNYLSSRDKNIVYEYIIKLDLQKYKKNDIDEVSSDKVIIDELSLDGFELCTSNRENSELNSEFSKDVFETDEEFKERIESTKPINIGIAEVDLSKIDDKTEIVFIKAILDKRNSIVIPKINGLYMKMDYENRNILKDMYKFKLCAMLKCYDNKVYIDIDKLYVETLNCELIKVNNLIFEKMDYEKWDEYKSRIEGVGEIPIGKAKLIKEQYDINTRKFPLQIYYFNFINEKEKFENPCIYLDRKIAKEIYDFQPLYNVYSTFKVVENEILIDNMILDSIKHESLKITNDYNDVLYCVQKGEKWGYIDRTGKVIIDFKYDDAEEFNNGIALVEKDGKNICINNNGKTVINLEYKYIGERDEGLIPVEKDGKCGFIDKTGKLVIDYNYDSVLCFSEGLAYVEKEGKYGYIDRVGKVIIDFEYDYAEEFSEGLAKVAINGKYRYIDKANRVVIDLEDNNTRYFHEGFTSIEKGDKYGFIDKTGKLAISCKYDYAADFSEGIASVEKDRKYGYIDKTGELVIGFEYDYAYSFSEGLACVKKNGKYGFIDRTGKLVIGFKYDYTGYFYEDIVCVKKNGKWGFINKEDQIVIGFEYDDVC